MTEEDQAPPPPKASGSADADSIDAPEVSRRVKSILDAVEAEAARLREDAQREADRYLEGARQRADRLVVERQQRIAELSDELLAKSEAVVGRLDDAAPVRQGFENLVRALGDAAERLAHETHVTGGELPSSRFREEPGAAPPPHPDRQAHTPPIHPPPLQYQPAAPDPFAHVPDRHAQQAPPPWPSLPQPGREDPFPGYPPQPHPGIAARPTGWQAQPPPASQPQPPAPAPAPGAASWLELDEARMGAIRMATAGATRAAVREHLTRTLGIGDTAGILDEIFGLGTGEDARVPWTTASR